MELPGSVEWALHCVWLLAQAPRGTALSGRRLAEFHDLPPAYLSKILKALTRAGVLDAVPGPHGGYRLGRAPERLTVLDVLVALDGDGPLFRCREIRQQGPVPLPARDCRRPCGIAAVMHRAEDAWRAELSATTVADLVAHAGIGSTDRARRWLASLPETPADP